MANPSTPKPCWWTPAPWPFVPTRPKGALRSYPLGHTETRATVFRHGLCSHHHLAWVYRLSSSPGTACDCRLHSDCGCSHDRTRQRHARSGLSVGADGMETSAHKVHAVRTERTTLRPIPGTGCERSGATAYSLRSGNVTERAVSPMCARGGEVALTRPTPAHPYAATDTVRTAPYLPPPPPLSPPTSRGEGSAASPDRPSAWSGAERAPCPRCGLAVKRDNLSRHLKRCVKAPGTSA